MSLLGFDAADIQAITAVISCGTTVALAYMTRAYVRLTHEMSKTAQRQLDTMLEDRKTENLLRERRLNALVKRFQDLLPPMPHNDESIRFFVTNNIWSEGDIEDFDRCMTARGPESSDLGRKMVDRLRWMLRRHTQAQTINGWNDSDLRKLGEHVFALGLELNFFDEDTNGQAKTSGN